MTAAMWLSAGAGLAAALPVVREALRAPMGPGARNAAPGAFAKLPGGTTHYRWQGAPRGPVLVCIHGLTTPSFVWDGLAPHLAEMGFRVLTYDLLGRGFSDRPRGAQTPAFFVQQLHDLLKHLKISDDATLFGYSMGGVIAAAYGAQHPHQLRRVVLLAPAGMEISLGRLAGFASDWPVLGDWAYQMGYPIQLRRGIKAESDVPKSVEGFADLQLNELRYRGHLRSILSSLRYTLRKPIPAIHKQLAGSGVPVAAIWGGDDRVIPIAGLGTLAQWNRTAQQEVIEAAGHSLAVTHSEQVANALRRVTGLA